MSPAIELLALAKTYPGYPPVQALRPSNLRVEHGDFVTIVGPSGSGKSTLLNLLGMLDRATEGTYLFDGVPVDTLTDIERTAVRGQRIGFVFQSFQLLPHRPAVENVMMALLYRGVSRKDQYARAVDCLESVGLEQRVHALPSRMSGGERQRVAIARALAGDPSVLLCDEPSGNLDSTNADSVLNLIEELNRGGRTIVLITHDAGIAKRGGRLVVIRDGQLSERHHAADSIRTVHAAEDLAR
ncbi:putative ABC transport system ATP-binding protein [Nocardioides sp. BE266]|uniref:ABC transporter ATP-binding protein n=1 Tax=Nocardioides sp. BE266 TaxID=2817725 RepID=UPI0028565873|nr:ABC transporter ATP-binding protein [Nocardioides sp. BE266]MDR7255076.1 putative ABC transport system ATP-binding protein [Nocardioides sp. BE266]